jgi:predicted amidohydrolase
MKIAVVQLMPIFGDIQRNLEMILGCIEKAEASLVVFPELALTGYFFQDRKETAQYAESFNGDSINTIQDSAEANNKIVIVGFPERDGENLYNSAAILFPDGALSAVHRKTHLFYKENLCFDKGDTGYFVQCDPASDCIIGTMICYDWRFPEAARSLAMKGADLIACPSNLVTPFWPLSMPARAIENKVFLAVANRYGAESRGGEEVKFNGKSVIYDYNGSTMASAPESGDSIITAEIDFEKTRNKSFNAFNNIFADRRPEMYYR